MQVGAEHENLARKVARRSRQFFRLNDAPKGYKDFDLGAAKKFVLDPHGMIPN